MVMMTPTKQQTRPFSKQLNVDKISQQQNIPSTNIVVNSWQSATLEVVKKTVFTQTDAVGPCQPKTQVAAQNSEESADYICEICGHDGFFSLLSLCAGLLFSQKGLSYGSENLHGVLSHKRIRFGVKTKLGDPPCPPGG